ncbi:hypothetical protein CDL15_Pgr022462 [Punica granatum]|uniref:Macro domain-containing protein n=1 Tax=Punica granatum TaxID=22663 RepID=A0A218XS45_PUNGR|nr:hypothetical protein CDL15_Pgr022462 [Punica granatum]
MRSHLLRGARAQVLLLGASTTSGTLSSSAISRPSEVRVLHRRRALPQFHSLSASAFKAASMSSQGGNAAGARTIHFSLSPASALVILQGDITKWSVDGSSDAVACPLMLIINFGFRSFDLLYLYYIVVGGLPQVNPANERMLGGGGADGAIHRAAGPELLEACYKVPEVRPGIRCPTGEARITPGFKLPASHVIHTVGPIYDTDKNPQESLRSAYKNSLAVAKENNIQYIAFPAISCGVYGYPYDEAAAVAISTVEEFSDGLKEVHFVLFSDEIYDAWSSKAKELLQK